MTGDKPFLVSVLPVTDNRITATRTKTHNNRPAFWTGHRSSDDYNVLFRNLPGASGPPPPTGHETRSDFVAVPRFSRAPVCGCVLKCKSRDENNIDVHAIYKRPRDGGRPPRISRKRHTFDLHVRFGFPSNSCAPSSECDPHHDNVFRWRRVFSRTPVCVPDNNIHGCIISCTTLPLPIPMFRRVLSSVRFCAAESPRRTDAAVPTDFVDKLIGFNNNNNTNQYSV